MNRLTIYSKTGSEVATVALKTNSEQSCKLLGEDIVKVFFESKVSISFNIGDYITVFGRTYTLNTFPVVRKIASRLFEYEATFESKLYELSKVVFLDLDASGVHMSHEFFVTGNIELFASLIENNLQRVYVNWTVNIIGLDVEEVKNLSFSESNCQQALKQICDEFGCEYEINSASGQHELVLREMTGGSSGYSFEYGKGNGLYEISRSLSTDNNLITRLYAFGASKNIGANYRDYSPRLRLPIVAETPDCSVTLSHIETGFPNIKIFGSTNADYVQLQIPFGSGWVDTGSPVLASVLNSYWLTFTQPPLLASFRLKAWKQTGKYVYSDGTSEGWSVNGDYIESPNINVLGLFERVVIFDDVFPEREGVVTALGGSVYEFIDSGMFDLNERDESNNHKYLLDGIDAKISFRTGNLAGYEFLISDFNTSNKKFTLSKYVDERGTAFPSENELAFQIQTGDKYVILDIAMPESYIEDAEYRLSAKASEWLNKYSNQQVVYELTVDPLFARDNSITFGVGDAVGVLDTDLGVNEQIRITEVVRNLVNEYEFKLKLSDSTFIPRKKSISRTEIKSRYDSQLKITPLEISDSHYIFNQGVPASVWYIPHNMGKIPAVSVIDTSGNEFEGEITHTDNNNLILNFSAPFAGYAHLN